MLSSTREEAAQKTFKQVLRDLTVLLKNATDMETVTMYWVNKTRGQFVLETYTSNCQQTMFMDRVAFENLYLNDYKDITEPVQLEVGKHVAEEELVHYFKEVPVRFITVLPFSSSGETVALTVLESKYKNLSSDEEETITSYMSALSNLLQTYLQLTGLSVEQTQWMDYEERLDLLADYQETVPMLQQLLNELQSYLERGGVSLLCRGMGEWNVIMNARFARHALPLGLQLGEHSVAWKALQSGKPEFYTHLNANPKRVSAREPVCNGATLAIPILIRGRRQAAIIVYDENPLVFNEATRHKFVNLVRVASLHLNLIERALKVTDDMLAGENTAYHANVLEAVTDIELQRLGLFDETDTWVGYITLADLQSVRTKLRLEEMKSLQKQMISELNPQKRGFYGYLTGHSDFVFGFIMQGKENPVEAWARELEAYFDHPYPASEQVLMRFDFHVGCIKLDRDIPDSSMAIKKAKTALADAIKNPQEIIIIGK